MISRARPVMAVPGQVVPDAGGARAAPPGSRARLRLFEVMLTLFLAGFLLTDLYPWLSSFNRVLGAVLGVLAISSWARRRGGIPAELVLFGVFILWGVLTGFFFARDQSRVMAYGRLLSQELVLAFALAEYVRERGSASFVFLLLLVVPICLFWYARSTGQLATAQEVGTRGHGRVSSFTSNANAAATLCLYGVFAVGYFIWNRKKQGLVFWPLLALPFIASSLVASASRKNLLSVGIFALMWALLTYGRARNSKVRSVLLLLTVVAALYAAGRFVVESTRVGERFRQTSGDPYVSTGRYKLYREGWNMFLQSPVQGVGLGNFVVYSSTGAYAHSDYMEVLATTGIVGFLLYFSIYLVLWRRLRRVLEMHPDPTSRYMAGLYQAMIVAFMLLGLGTPNFLSALHLYLIGVLVGHAHGMEQDLHGPHPSASRATYGVASPQVVASSGASRLSA